MREEGQPNILIICCVDGTGLLTQMDGLGGCRKARSQSFCLWSWCREMSPNKTDLFFHYFLRLDFIVERERLGYNPGCERLGLYLIAPWTPVSSLPYPLHRLAGHPVTLSFISCFFPSADTNASLARPPINQPKDCVPSQEITSLR